MHSGTQRVGPLGVIVLSLFALPASLRAETDAQQKSSTSAGNVALTSGEMIQRAVTQLGLTDTNGMRATAVYLSEPGELIPGVQPEPVWRVSLESVPLRLGVGSNVRTNAYVCALEMDFSERTGNMVRLLTRWPEDVSGTPFSALAPERKRVEGGWIKKLGGLPRIAPKVSLLQALGEQNTHATLAKQVVVYYVLARVQPAGDERPYWIIDVLEIPPIPLSRGRPGPTRYRSVIDSVTGGWRGSSWRAELT